MLNDLIISRLMFRPRATASMILSVLVFYNTGTLLGLHVHDHAAGEAAVHTHGLESHADHRQNFCQAEPEQAPLSIALLQQKPHFDFSLLSDFILSEVGAITDSPVVLRDFIARSSFESMIPEPPALAGIRIRDGTLPDPVEINRPASSRAPPFLF